jgi:hypothetical protein
MTKLKLRLGLMIKKMLAKSKSRLETTMRTKAQWKRELASALSHEKFEMNYTDPDLIKKFFNIFDIKGAVKSNVRNF